jgi:hypothetical protein
MLHNDALKVVLISLLAVVVLQLPLAAAAQLQCNA